MSEYVAVAAGEKRLREILSPLLGEATLELVIMNLTAEGVTADYKPRLKAVLLTVPMPDTRIKQAPHPDPAAVVEPDPTPTVTTMKVPNEDCWCGGPVGQREPGDDLGRGCLVNITHDWMVPEHVNGVELGGPEPVASPAPIVPRFGGMFLPRFYNDEDDLRDIGIY